MCLGGRFIHLTMINEHMDIDIHYKSWKIKLCDNGVATSQIILWDVIYILIAIILLIPINKIPYHKNKT